jgi:hypothetical protein
MQGAQKDLRRKKEAPLKCKGLKKTSEEQRGTSIMQGTQKTYGEKRGTPLKHKGLRRPLPNRSKAFFQ